MAEADRATQGVTIVAFPFAGGGGYSFHQLARCLDPGLSLTTHEYPGHGQRMPEPLLTSVADLAADALARLEGSLFGPFAFLGYSLGALVALEAARALAREGRPGPRVLVVVAAPGPSRLETGRQRHLLPADQFRALLERFAGTPPAVLAEPKLMALFEPILRADFQAVDTYDHCPRPPLDLPITAVRGREDLVEPRALAAWQEETRFPLTLAETPGGHFGPLGHAPDLAGIIRAALGEGGGA